MPILPSKFVSFRSINRFSNESRGTAPGHKFKLRNSRLLMAKLRMRFVQKLIRRRKYDVTFDPDGNEIIDQF